MQKYYDIISIGTCTGGETVKHNTTKLYAISTVPNKTVFHKTFFINDFYFGSPEDAKPLDRFRLMGKYKWNMMLPDFPRWVAKSLLKVFANRSVDRWMQSKDLPNVENRVGIAKNKQIKVYYRPNNQKVLRRLRHQVEKVFQKVGFLIIFGIPMLLKAIDHQGGTCRYGK
ncbi:MAG: hypothetical protein WA959_06885 [Rivularia sp. (in: cyanobacteria)]